MTTTETFTAWRPGQASTKHICVDARFIRLLPEDFAMSVATILDALVDEPQKQAIAICEWASRTDDPEGDLLCCARKHSKSRCYRAQGTGRPTRRHVEISQSPREQQDGPSRGSSTAATRTVVPCAVAWLTPGL